MLIALFQLFLTILDVLEDLLDAVVAGTLGVDAVFERFQVSLLEEFLSVRAGRLLEGVELLPAIGVIVIEGNLAASGPLDAVFDVVQLLIHPVKVGGVELLLTHLVLFSSIVLVVKQLLLALVLLLLRDATVVEERLDGLLVGFHPRW